MWSILKVAIFEEKKENLLARKQRESGMLRVSRWLLLVVNSKHKDSNKCEQKSGNKLLGKVQPIRRKYT